MPDIPDDRPTNPATPSSKRSSWPAMTGPKVASPGGRIMIAGFEGRRRQWYRDEADIETGGVGHKRRPGDPDVFDDAQIDAWEANDLRVSESCVNSCVTVPIGQNAFDALVSLAFNIGTGAERASTVIRKLDAGDYAGAADAFLMWVKVEDPKTKQLVVSANLTARRKAERLVFLRDVPPAATVA